MNGLTILYNFLFFIFTSVLSKQQLSHTKISPGISLEGMMLKLKLKCFGHFMWRVDSLEDFDAGRDWGQEEKRTPEDEMAGWHHWLDGRESEWTPGVGDGQGGLAGCDSWDRKESDTTERLNWTEVRLWFCFFKTSLFLDPSLLSCYHNYYSSYNTSLYLLETLPLAFLLFLLLLFLFLLEATHWNDNPCFVAHSCLTLCNPMDHSPQGSSVHWIFQARILEWVAISFSRGSCWPMDQTCISCVFWIAGKFLTPWALGIHLRLQYPVPLTV